MPAQTKRRRYSLLTLPVVVAIGVLLVAKLAAWQRSDLIADLSDCISHGETREAMEAVHKLAAMPNPPIPVLVTAAACDEHETAAAAQVAIDRLLRRWQRDVERKEHVGSIATQLSELAQSLSDELREFSDTDHTWLESTARKIMRIANVFPPPQTPLVAAHCDTILTAIGAGRYSSAPNGVPVDDDPNNVIGEKTGSKLVSPREFAGDREPSTFASPSESGLEGNEHTTDKAATGGYVWPASDPPAETDSLLHSGDDAAGTTADKLPANSLRGRSGGEAHDDGAGRLSSRPGPLEHSGASQPIFRILPAMPINVAPQGGDAAKRLTPDSRTASDSDDAAANGRLAKVDSRELLRTWLAAEGGEAQPIERELAKRGFGKLSKRLVQQFFSENAQDRMRLVDNVLAQPGAGSEAWLLLLAGDSDADVRLFAVTFMATSSNGALVEKAWQLAIRDHDPRVADLAGRLRERRDETLRR